MSCFLDWSARGMPCLFDWSARGAPCLLDWTARCMPRPPRLALLRPPLSPSPSLRLRRVIEEAPIAEVRRGKTGVLTSAFGT